MVYGITSSFDTYCLFAFLHFHMLFTDSSVSQLDILWSGGLFYFFHLTNIDLITRCLFTSVISMTFESATPMDSKMSTTHWTYATPSYETDMGIHYV